MVKVSIAARLTHDPELKHVGANNTAFTYLTVASNRPGKDAGTDFIRVQVWGAQAENACKYLSKGRLVAIDGRIKTDKYTDKEGKTVYTTDIVANSVEYLGSSGNSAGGSHAASAGNSEPVPKSVEDEYQEMEEDIPF